MHILGIDIAKDSFDVTLLGGQQPLRGTFDNNEDSFVKLQRWLSKRSSLQSIPAFRSDLATGLRCCCCSLWSRR